VTVWHGYEDIEGMAGNVMALAPMLLVFIIGQP